jgi:2,6-dihydroxypyridine 3-monooxygenase
MARAAAGDTKPRVVVVGGSLGGLHAALWLRDAGCAVEVFERSPVLLQDRGSGIVLNPATVRYFVGHGLHPAALSATANWFRYMSPDGSVAHQERSQYRFAAYSTLYAQLLDAFGQGHYHLAEECTGFDQDPTGVTARFASGRDERGNMLVFADGINSVGRRMLLPDVAPRYAGYVAWRGTVDETALSRKTFDALHAAITYVVLPDSHALSYPIPALGGAHEPGRRLINWLWYRNVDPGPQLDDFLTGRGGVYFGTSVPPGLVEERHVTRLREDAAALAPPFAEMIARTTGPFVQVVFDLEVPRMAFGRTCLIGDAAFTARPHAAAGTAKVAEDAWTLGRAVAACRRDIIAALGRWEAGQLALGRQVVARSREAGERLQHGTWPVGEPPPFGLYTVGDSAFTEEARQSDAGPLPADTRRQSPWPSQ